MYVRIGCCFGTNKMAILVLSRPRISLCSGQMLRVPIRDGGHIFNSSIFSLSRKFYHLNHLCIVIIKRSRTTFEVFILTTFVES